MRIPLLAALLLSSAFVSQAQEFKLLDGNAVQAWKFSNAPRNKVNQLPPNWHADLSQLLKTPEPTLPTKDRWSAPIDSELILQPPPSSSSNTPRMQNLYPGLQWMPLTQPKTTTEARLEQIPSVWPESKIEPIPSIWPKLNWTDVTSPSPKK